MIEVESFSKFWNGRTGYNTPFGVFFWLNAISCLIFRRRYIVIIEWLLLQQVLNFNRMAWKNFNLVYVTWYKSKYSWDISFLCYEQVVAELLHICEKQSDKQCSANNKFQRNMLTWNNFDFFGFWFFATTNVCNK